MDDSPRIAFIPVKKVKCHRVENKNKDAVVSNLQNTIADYKEQHQRFEEYEKAIARKALEKYREAKIQLVQMVMWFLLGHIGLSALELVLAWRLLK